MGLITRGSNGEGLATTGIVRDSRQAGSSILELQSTKNFVDDNEIFHFAQWTMDTTNKPVPGTLIEGTAKLISSGHISIESLDPGFTDIGSSIGDIFMIKPTTGWVNDLYGALTETLNQDGTIRDDVASDIVADKQDTLVSSVNIKTINNQSMLGSGNISTPNTTYSEITEAEIEGGNGTALRTITARRTKKIIDTAKEGKQNTLVSGTNIRYINGYGLMGSGNVELTGEDISVSTDDASTVASAIELISTIVISLINDKQDKLVSGQTIKTINGASLLGAGNIDVSGGGSGGSVYSVNGKTGNVELDKTDIGLSLVDNTADVNKPVSIEQQAVLDEKVNKTTVASVVYATDDGGVDKHIPYSDDIVAGAVAVRSDNGTLRGAEPIASDDLVNKAHLDSELANKVDSVNGKTGEVSVLEVPEGGATGQVVKKTASGYAWGADNNTQYEEIPTGEITAGTASTARAISGRSAQEIVNKAILATKEALYPVGSTYFNKTNSTNPATLLGFGTWARLEGVVLGGRSEAGGSPFNVAAGTIIGADTHTLTQAQLPAVSGLLILHGSENGSYFIGATGVFSSSPTVSGKYGNLNYQTGSTSKTQIKFNLGSGGSHPIVQRTLVGYLWERTA